jgi:hypothetical protein
MRFSIMEKVGERIKLRETYILVPPDEARMRCALSVSVSPQHLRTSFPDAPFLTGLPTLVE